MIEQIFALSFLHLLLLNYIRIILFEIRRDLNSEIILLDWRRWPPSRRNNLPTSIQKSLQSLLVIFTWFSLFGPRLPTI